MNLNAIAKIICTFLRIHKRSVQFVPADEILSYLLKLRNYETSHFLPC